MELSSPPFVYILSIEMQNYPLQRGTENCLLCLNAKRCVIYGVLIHNQETSPFIDDSEY